MIGKHSQAVKQPTIQDIMTQTSAYGATIPLIIGTVLEPPLLIWMGGIHQVTGSKKSKKSNAQITLAQVDMLLGHNPIQTVLRCWENGPAIGSGLPWNKIAIGTVSSYTISDPNFYCVIAVTATISYSANFNDFGAQGTSSVSGSYEIPLWNEAMQGPDPSNPSAYRWAPYTYKCIPFSTHITDMRVPGGANINVYYASLPTSGWGAGTTPLAKVMNCVFESTLGEGQEYGVPVNLSAQQIMYPMYAGAGTPSFNLGLGVVPQLKLEVVGCNTLYPTGLGNSPATNVVSPDPGGPHIAADADFADMIETILKQGMAQGALLTINSGTPTGRTPVQTGCSSFDFPGTVQKKFWSNTYGNWSGSITYDLPVTKGDILVVAAAGTGTTYGISDSLSNSWSAVLSTGGRGFWYATANAGGTCTVTLTGVNTAADVMIFAIAGCDTVDVASAFTGVTLSNPTGSITTTNNINQDAYVLVWVFPNLAGSTGSGNYAGWLSCIPSVNQGGNFYGYGTNNSYAVQRRVSQPQTISFTGDQATASWAMVMLGVKNAVAPAFPKPFANMIDDTTLNQCRMQCRANGLWGSLLMNSQKKAGDWLKDIYDAANTAPLWSGFVLKSVPRSEVSTAGNGAIYTSPTASGPLVNLVASDMIGNPTGPLVQVDRTGTTDRQNLMRMQFPERNNQYRSGTISQPDQGGLALTGLRSDSPRKMDMVQDVNIAKMLLGIMVRRKSLLIRKFKFKLQARFKLLEAMDLVYITDEKIGLINAPVRLTSVAEDDKFNLDCEAEDFIYGMNAPRPINVTTASATNPGTQYVPAAVNTPVFLEPPSALTQVANDQLWIGVSDSDTQYGGCQAYVSVDGGTSYAPLISELGTSIISGNATTGVTTANWAQALDPDTTNDLSVDLTESNGALSQYTASQEDQFLFPCYVAGGGGIYPFEIMCYAVANLTATFKYTLKATGGGGNHLRRAVFGTWAATNLPNTGAAHTSPSRFMFLDPAGVGMMKVNVPNAWVGKTLFFKFVQFNNLGGGSSTLAAATAYSYTILGNQNTGGSGGGQSGYTINPTNPLSQTSTTNIAMTNVVATWTPSGLQTWYAARNFTIVAPSAPTQYWVTVYDPTMTGDQGSSATLTAYCSNTSAGAHVNQAGYVYMGYIIATPSGTGGGTGGGGSNGGNVNPYDLGVQLPGAPAGNTTYLIWEFDRTVIFSGNFSGSNGKCLTNPTSTATFTVLKNGSSIGTVVISTGGAFTFTTTGGAAVTFNVGDYLEITTPNPQDNTLADVGWVFAGTR